MKICLRVCIAVLAASLAGCAGHQAYTEGRELIDQGRLAEGFAKMEEAIRLEPEKLEYRTYLARERAIAASRLIASAETERRQEHFDKAETVYRAVLAADPGNDRAVAGLAALDRERRYAGIFRRTEELVERGAWQEARELLRPVLAEEPRQRRARELQERIAAIESRERPAQPQLPKAYATPVTVSFRDAPLRAVLDTLSRASGVNFYLDKDVRADLRVSVTGRDTTLEELLRALLATNQLDQRVLNDSTVLVYPNTPAKQREYLNLMVRSFYLARADAKQVAQTLRAILKVRDLSVNEKLNLIIMRDSPQMVKLAERLIALEDIAESEVTLEVEVMEVKRSRLATIGVQWPDRLDLSVPSSTPSGSFTLRNLRALNSGNVNAALSDLIVNLHQQDTDANLLANPLIRVRNREKARIMIGDKVPVVTTTASATGFVGENVTYLDVGLKLEVEPVIDREDDVAIKVNLEVSSIVNQVQTNSGTIAYQIGSRNAQTLLQLHDGETQVLAGLINDSDRRTATKVPGLGDLPVLGRLFSSHDTDGEKTEIVLSITPHLVRNNRRPPYSETEFQAGTDASPGGGASMQGGSQLPLPERPRPSIPQPPAPSEPAPAEPPPPPASTGAAQPPRSAHLS
jgi:general secretion pathway protein D